MSCTCSSVEQCRFCVERGTFSTTLADRWAALKASAALEAEEIHEVARWFASWTARTPDHKNPALWTFSATCRLAWNALPIWTVAQGPRHEHEIYDDW
jgi:hypothetical protein